MPVRRGKCINFGNCDKADSRAIIEVPEGAEFVCPDPDCGKALDPSVPNPNGRGWVKVAMAALAGVIIVGGITYLVVSGLPSDRSATTEVPPAPSDAASSVGTTSCDLNAMEDAHRRADCTAVVRIGEACAAEMPNDATVLNNLATGLLACGDASRAGELLGRAVELKPNDPYLRYNQACVAARSGNKDDAVDHLKTACQLGLAPATFLQDPDLASLAGYAPFEELVVKKDCE